MRRRARDFLATAAVLHATTIAFAEVGAAPPRPATRDDPRVLTVQTDEKLVAAGGARFPKEPDALVPGPLSAIALVRYRPDGTLDPTFGQGGRVLTPLAKEGEAVALVVQADGMLVVAAEDRLGILSSALVLARYRTDGSLDPSFGVDGLTRTDFEHAWQRTRALLPLPDGGFVVGGQADVGGTLVPALARFDRNGRVDQSFGRAGLAASALGGGRKKLAPPAMIATADGGVIAAMTDERALVLVRWNADGTRDPRFGVDGVVRATAADANAATAADSESRSLAEVGGVRIWPDSDGGLLVAGNMIAAGHRRVAVVRFDASGRLDHEFGVDGIAETRLDDSGGPPHMGVDENAGNDVMRLPNGAIVTTGRRLLATRGWALAVARLRPDGTLDRSFGTDGTSAVAFAGADVPAAVAWQGARLVVLGQVGTDDDTDFGIAAFRPDGTLDPTFGIGGRVTTDLGGDDRLRAVVAAHPASVPRRGSTPTCEDRMPKISGSRALGFDVAPIDDPVRWDLGFFGLGEPAPRSVDDPEGPLALRLRAEADRRPGEPLGLVLEVVNRSAGPLRVHVPDRDRYVRPRLYLYLRDESDRLEYAFEDRRGGCGNPEPHDSHAFHGLDAGAALAVAHHALDAAAPLTPGRYTLWMALAHCRTDDTPPPDGVPQGVFVSNAVTVTVLAPATAP